MRKFMRSGFCVAGVSVVLATGAFAQDNVIRVIQDDGSVAEFEIPAPAPQAPPTPVPDSPSGDGAVFTETPQSAPAGDSSSVPARTPDTVMDTITQPASKGAGSSPAVPPAAKPAQKTEQAKPAVPVPQKAGVARRKNEARQHWPETTAPHVTPETEIDRDMALSIAMQHAPPARGVKVVRRTYQEREVFVVSFRTDNGSQDVLVDAVTGDIVPVQ